MQSSIPLGDLPEWALPAIIVFGVVQLVVEVCALVVMFKTPVERLVFGKRWPWVLIILLVNLVGAIVFLAAGRKPRVASDPLAASAAAPVAPPRKRAERAMDVLYGDQDTGGASAGSVDGEGDAR